MASNLDSCSIVYQGQPCSVGSLGRFIDRLCLNSVGWRASRERFAMVKDAVRAAIWANVERGEPTILLDLGCGSGRGTLEVLAEFPAATVNAMLWDYRRENCERARSLASEMGLSAAIECRDVFSREAMNGVAVRPNVVIVAGLHEVTLDDDLVGAHFHQLSRILTRPGRLIVTVQVHHPQPELVRPVLRTHRGMPWAMPLRSLDVTSRWAASAGFVVMDVRMDSFGICGVMSAEIR